LRQKKKRHWEKAAGKKFIQWKCRVKKTWNYPW